MPAATRKKAKAASRKGSQRKEAKHDPSQGIHRHTQTPRVGEMGIVGASQTPGAEIRKVGSGVHTIDAPDAGSADTAPASQLGKKGSLGHAAMGAHPKPARKATRKTPRSSSKALKAAHADKARNQRRAPRQGG